MLRSSDKSRGSISLHPTGNDAWAGTGRNAVVELWAGRSYPANNCGTVSGCFPTQACQLLGKERKIETVVLQGQAVTIRSDLLATITDHYLKSPDFNGLPVHALKLPTRKLKTASAALLKEGKISINFGDIHPNPHIKAFEPEPIAEQQDKLKKFGLDGACFYPSPSHLQSIVKPSDYDGLPFTLRLARGEPQLEFLTFDLRVLETYRNDPRYRYVNDDIQGTISVSDSYSESAAMRDSDQVILQTFGFAYTEEMNRAVAVYLRYLADLSAGHQQDMEWPPAQW